MPRLSSLPTAYVAVADGIVERVIPVLIGALIALLGSVAVQIWLVPHVERQKRRHENWEADVRALGEVLMSEQSSLLEKLIDEVHLVPSASSDENDHSEEAGGPQAIADLVGEVRTALAASAHKLRVLGFRIDLLTERIVSFAPTERDARDFSAAARQHKASIEAIMIWAENPPAHPLDDPHIDVLMNRNTAVHAASAAIVEQLHDLYLKRPARRRIVSSRS